VVVRLVEQLVVHVAEYGPPVAQEEVGRAPAVKLAQKPLELVASVAVQEHDLPEAAVDQRVDQIADHRVERGRIEVHRQRELALVGLRAVRDGG